MTTLLAAFLIAVPVPMAEEEPTGVPPELQYVKYDKGTFETTTNVTSYEQQTQTVEVVVNGQKVLQTRIVAVPVIKTVKMALNAKGAEVFGLDGKKIDETTWQKALSSGAVVVLARDGSMPHAGYRKIFREGTLIVVLKPMPPMPPMPLPAPAVPMLLPAPKQ